MTAQIIPFPPRLRVASDNPLFQRIADTSDRFDRAAEALRRRDYAGFDRIMGREPEPPFGGDAA